MPPSTPDQDKKKIDDLDDDWENCKGRCGYTVWCRACIAERKQKELEAERKEHPHDD